MQTVSRRTLMALGLVSAASAGLPALAQGTATEVSGIRYAATQQLAGTTLQLNGAGQRSRFLVKVYTAGLYLGGKATTPQAVYDMPGPKRLHVVMQREIDANELGRLFTRGMQDNAPRDGFSKFIPGTIQLAELFAARKRLLARDQFFIDFVPGVGTSVVVNGQPQGEPIREPEFFNALMRIWLGDKPADGDLKDALLGRKTSNVGGSPGQQ
jgi:hypothetical protein